MKRSLLLAVFFALAMPAFSFFFPGEQL